MKIKYENTLDDHINFVKDHASVSKITKQIVIWYSILNTLIFIYWKMNNPEDYSSIYKFLIGLIIIIVLFLYFIKQTTHKQSLKHFQNKENKGFFCKHELVIDESGINDITEVGNQYVK